MTSVKVRIAVAVDDRGDWYAVGWKDALSDDMEGDALGQLMDGSTYKQLYWITAELPIPEPVKVEGTVEE